MPKPNVADLLRRIAGALKPLHLRWYVFGAQAVIAAGATRSTADIDITVEDIEPGRLLRALNKAGFALRDDVEDIESVVDSLRVLPLAHSSGFQVDVVRAGPGLEMLMLERAITRRIGRTAVPFVETNDLVVLKILASRPKDLEDVRALLRLDLDELDLTVVRARLRELGKLLDDSTLVRSFELEAKNAKR